MASEATAHARAETAAVRPVRETLRTPLSPLAAGAGIAFLALLPLAALGIDEPFYIVLATRIVIYALVATSLNLLIGYGGMVSFGHAAFFGGGAYAVATLMMAGVESAWVLWPAAMVAGAALALVFGAFSLRTHGVYFIMITLALAQMLYYLVQSLRVLGSDDGLALPHRPSLGLGLDLRDDTTLYYIVALVFVVAIWLFRRLLNSRLGHALQGIRDNETRMEAVGFPTYRIKLTVFVIAGAAAGLGGGLLATLNGFVGPSVLYWPESGILMIMVLLGGAGHLLGGAVGAVVLLVAEEILSSYTIHWQLGIGIFLVAAVLFAPQGIAGLLARRR